MNEIVSTYPIVFLRHGEPVGNAEDRFQGQADFPLTEKGRTQAKVRAERWLVEGVTFDSCISSPLLRALQTAEIVTQVLNVPLEFDTDWMEINNGLLAGLSDEEAEKIAPRPDFMTPHALWQDWRESLGIVSARRKGDTRNT